MTDASDAANSVFCKIRHGTFVIVQEVDVASYCFQSRSSTIEGGAYSLPIALGSSRAICGRFGSTVRDGGRVHWVVRRTRQQGQVINHDLRSEGGGALRREYLIRVALCSVGVIAGTAHDEHLECRTPGPDEAVSGSPLRERLNTAYEARYGSQYL